MSINIDVESLKREGFSFEEIQEIIESEEEFEKTGIAYDFDEVKIYARKELFSKTGIYV